jgi:hypothetical protein
MYLPERGQIDPEALMRADKAHGELPPHPVLDVRTLSYATECGATVDVFDARGGALASANVQGPALMHEAKVTVFGKPNILRVLTMHPPPPPNSA